MAAKKSFNERVRFYDYGAVLSRNAVFNVVIGPRGDGKTYGAKQLAIKNAIKKGEQFILLRRYSTELGTRVSFFDDIAHNIQKEFPGYMFRVEGLEAQMKKPGSRKYETIGYFVALSKAQQKKSVSYAKVTTVIFDEFIIDKGAVRYLPNETKVLLDFFITVDRYQERTRVLMISNTVSIMNPYFIDWDIKVEDYQEFITRGTDESGLPFVVVHLIKDHAFASEVRKTRVGRFIDGTEYADYAIDGTFADNHLTLVKNKPPNAHYYATVETDTGTFSLWIDTFANLMYADEKRPKKETILVTVPERMAPGKVLVLRSDKTMQSLRTAFSHGRLFFSSARARNAFIGVMKR